LHLDLLPGSIAVERRVVRADAAAVAVDQLHPALVAPAVMGADDLGLGGGSRERDRGRNQEKPHFIERG